MRIMLLLVESATQELFKRDRDAVTALVDGARSTDLETGFRCASILTHMLDVNDTEIAGRARIALQEVASSNPFAARVCAEDLNKRAQQAMDELEELGAIIKPDVSLLVESCVHGF